MGTAAAPAKTKKKAAPASAAKPTTGRWKEPSTYVGILAAVLSGFNIYQTAAHGAPISPADVSGIAAGIYAVTNREPKNVRAAVAAAGEQAE